MDVALQTSIDYVTGIGNAHSVSPVHAHLQSFLAQPPPALTSMPLSYCLELLPCCVMLCNVLTTIIQYKHSVHHPVIPPSYMEPYSGIRHKGRP